MKEDEEAIKTWFPFLSQLDVEFGTEIEKFLVFFAPRRQASKEVTF